MALLTRKHQLALLSLSHESARLTENPQVKLMAWAVYFEELEEFRKRYYDNPTQGTDWDGRKS